MIADIIIKSDSIFDSIGKEPFKGYVAVKGNKIIRVEKGHDYSMFCGENTKIYDEKNKTVMAGFHDSHTHLILAGMYKAYVNLGNAKSEEEAAAMLNDFVNETQNNEEWIFGFNWYNFYWDKKDLPTKKSLDKYFPNRPVFLLNAEAHGAWVNSKALEIAGITKETEDPFGGEFERDENGEPTGFLYEAAITNVAKKALSFTKSQEETYLKKFMEEAAKLGITSVVDVQPYFGRDLGSLDVYVGLEKKKELTIRIAAASDLLGDLDKALENSKKYNTEKVKAHMLKQFVDGVFPTHTALLLEEYNDKKGNFGMELSPLKDIRAAILEAQKRDLWIKIHAIGDRAIRFTLDSYEEAFNKYGRKNVRHAIEHLELVSENDFHRFKELSIIPSVQPEHLGLMPTWEGEEYRRVLGEERAGKTWSFKRLLEESGTLALGSDCPVVDNNPFLAIHRGLTRLHDDGLPEGGWNKSQKLDLHELLKAYTQGSAYSVGREKEIGTLEENKFADIVVIDRNLFDSTPKEIREAQIQMTIMDGKIIYKK